MHVSDVVERRDTGRIRDGVSLHQAYGHPGASAVSFDNDLLNEDGSNFGKLFAEAERKRKSQIKAVKKMTIGPDAEREMIRRRIALLDVLFDAGADVALARKKLEFARLVI